MKKCGRNGHATYDTIIRRIGFACCVIQTTDTQSEYAIVLLFNGNDSYSNGLHCYFIRILPVFCFSLPLSLRRVNEVEIPDS
jgi:hypothetical protein